MKEKSDSKIFATDTKYNFISNDPDKTTLKFEDIITITGKFKLTWYRRILYKLLGFKIIE